MTTCPHCAASGIKPESISILPGFHTTSWSSPFYDSEGVYHHHDRNVTVNQFQCSVGHTWEVVHRSTCPASGCDFGRDGNNG